MIRRVAHAAQQNLLTGFLKSWKTPKRLPHGCMHSCSHVIKLLAMCLLAVLVATCINSLRPNTPSPSSLLLCDTSAANHCQVQRDSYVSDTVLCLISYVKLTLLSPLRIQWLSQNVHFHSLTFSGASIVATKAPSRKMQTEGSQAKPDISQAKPDFSQVKPDFSVEAMLYLDYEVQPMTDRIALSYGHLQLVIRAPAAPALEVAASVAEYSTERGVVAACGSWELRRLLTWSDAQAARCCARTSGCSGFVRNKGTGGTLLCGSLGPREASAQHVLGMLKRNRPFRPADYKHSLPLNSWHHVVATYSGSTEIGRTYVNGVLLLEESHALPRAAAVQMMTQSVLHFGRSPLQPWMRAAPAKLGNVRLWQRQLPLADVQALYNLSISAVLGNAPTPETKELVSDKYVLYDSGSNWLSAVPYPWTLHHGAPKSLGEAPLMFGSRLRNVTYTPGAASQKLLGADAGGAGAGGAGGGEVRQALQRGPRISRVSVVVVLHKWSDSALQVITNSFSETISGCPSGSIPTMILAITEKYGEVLPHQREFLGQLGARTGVPLLPIAESFLPDTSRRGASHVVRYAARLAADVAGPQGYVMLITGYVVPQPGWLSSLLGVLQSQPSVGAVHSKVVHPNGAVLHFGYSATRAHVESLGDDVAIPVDQYLGYPNQYSRLSTSASVQVVDATQCHSLLLRQELLLSQLPHLGHGDGDYDPQWAATRASRSPGSRHGLSPLVAVTSASVVVLDTSLSPSASDWSPGLGQARGATPPKWLLLEWGPALESALEEREAGQGVALGRALVLPMEVGKRDRAWLPVSWVVECGGEAARGAIDMMQGIEGRVPVRVQSPNPSLQCSKADLAEGAASSLRHRIERMRHLGSLLPSSVYVYQMGCEEIGAWVWLGENRSSVYLVGRFSFATLPLTGHMAEQCRELLDEVWVPSKWHAQQLEKHGVSRHKVVVVPESLDTALFDPHMWDPLPIFDGHASQLGFTMLAVFNTDEREGWGELLNAYSQAFRKHGDSLLVIRVESSSSVYPPSAREDVLAVMKSLGIHGNSKPRIMLITQRLEQTELIRLYKSVDAFVLPSHSRHGIHSLMEAMSMGLLCISSPESWASGLISSDNAIVVQHGGVASADGLEQAMIEAQKSSVDIRRDLGAAARSTLMESYDVFKVGAQVVDELRRVQEAVEGRGSGLNINRGEVHSPLVKVHQEVTGCPPSLHLPQRPSPRTRAHSGAPIKVAVITPWPSEPSAMTSGLTSSTTKFAFNSISSLKTLLPPGSSVSMHAIVEEGESGLYSNDPTVKSTLRIGSVGDYTRVAGDVNTKADVVLIYYAAGMSGGMCESMSEGRSGGRSEGMTRGMAAGISGGMSRGMSAGMTGGMSGGAEGALIACLVRMLIIPTALVVHDLKEGGSENVVAHTNLMHTAVGVDRVVVMSNRSRDAIAADHGVPPSKCAVIPRGMPNFPARLTPSMTKAEFGWQGRTVFLTYGPLHHASGVELVLQALPSIVSRFPHVLYVVWGAPHPKEAEHGVYYLAWLRQVVRASRLEGYVQFLEEDLGDEKLSRVVLSSDVCIFPDRERGVAEHRDMSLAIAAGRALVAAASKYAKEVVPAMGFLVPYDDSSSIGQALEKLVAEPSLMSLFGRAAFDYAKHMSWPEVAKEYVELLNDISVK
eukprot:gene14438-20445_t